jgi:uncharacterized cupredoxin-like copper-binding protein
MTRPAGRATSLILPLLLLAAACEPGPAPATPPISPGTATAPRDVNLIARDFEFVPQTLDVVPGESVVLHLINGGLDVHEVVIGDAGVQDAWEAAEAATADAPPGPTPVVSVPPDTAGLRVVLTSGQRVDVAWTVPPDPGAPLIVGCHIPGHWDKGMHIPVRFVEPGGGAARRAARAAGGPA